MGLPEVWSRVVGDGQRMPAVQREGKQAAVIPVSYAAHATVNDYTNGAPYLITQVETVGEYSKRIHFLFPDGSRRGVVIPQADDSPALRDELGKAWAEGRTSLTKGQHR